MKTLNYSLAILTVLSLFLLPSCQDEKTKEDLLKFQQTEATEASNIEIIKHFFKLLDDLKLEECNNLVAPDIRWNVNSQPYVFKDAITNLPAVYSAFPDFKHNIGNIFAADDYVVAQINYTGTHFKKYMEIDSTGNKIEYKGICIFKMADGKILEGQIVEDFLTLYNQLGLELR